MSKRSAFIDVSFVFTILGDQIIFFLMPLSMNLYLKEVQISTFVSSVAKMILKFYLDQLPVFLRKRHTEEAYMNEKIPVRLYAASTCWLYGSYSIWRLDQNQRTQLVRIVFFTSLLSLHSLILILSSNRSIR